MVWEDGEGDFSSYPILSLSQLRGLDQLPGMGDTQPIAPPFPATLPLDRDAMPRPHELDQPLPLAWP